MQLNRLKYKKCLHWQAIALLIAMTALLSLLTVPVVASDANGKESVKSHATGPGAGSAVGTLSAKEQLTLTLTERQRAGDASIGRDWMLSGAYSGCGIPRAVFDRTIDQGSDLASVPGRSDESVGLPYFASDVADQYGERVVSNNCLVCHGAPLFGNIVEGLGHEFLNFTEDPSRAVERAGLLITNSTEERSWAYFADRIATVSPYIVAHTVGVNVANNLTFALIAHRDPQTLAWSEQPFIDPPEQYPLPVSVPPWWRLKYKQGMFYQGQGQGDHARIMMTAALLCAGDQVDVRAADQMAPHLRQYIQELEPPVYPFDIDPEVAESGRLIFNDTCSRCHGRYDDQAFYPDLIIPIETVGTDPALAVQAAQDYQRFNDWYAESLFGDDTDIVAAEGYSAPPLEGVWATAPFLHNGSVPDIALMLNSRKRPTFWRYPANRSSTAAFYDQQTLGWIYETLPQGKSDSNSYDENAAIYDTLQFGYGNGGHRFGDHLSETDRHAVLEYLKTL